MLVEVLIGVFKEDLLVKEVLLKEDIIKEDLHKVIEEETVKEVIMESSEEILGVSEDSFKVHIVEDFIIEDIILENIILEEVLAIIQEDLQFNIIFAMNLVIL